MKTWKEGDQCVAVVSVKRHGGWSYYAAKLYKATARKECRGLYWKAICSIARDRRSRNVAKIDASDYAKEHGLTVENVSHGMEVLTDEVLTIRTLEKMGSVV